MQRSARPESSSLTLNTSAVSYTHLPTDAANSQPVDRHTNSQVSGFKPLEMQWTGEVLEVYDGDTMRVSVPSRSHIWIRLGRIDCPELGQPGDIVARLATERLVRGQAVTVTITDTKVIDRTVWYRGVVGDIHVSDGRDLAAELVRQGFAWADTNHWNDPATAQLEVDARSTRQGLWGKARPQPPWQYRSAHPQTLLRVPHPTQFDDLTVPPPGTQPPTVHTVP